MSGSFSRLRRGLVCQWRWATRRDHPQDTNRISVIGFLSAISSCSKTLRLSGLVLSRTLVSGELGFMAVD